MALSRPPGVSSSTTSSPAFSSSARSMAEERKSAVTGLMDEAIAATMTGPGGGPRAPPGAGGGPPRARICTSPRASAAASRSASFHLAISTSCVQEEVARIPPGERRERPSRLMSRYPRVAASRPSRPRAHRGPPGGTDAGEPPPPSRQAPDDLPVLPLVQEKTRLRACLHVHEEAASVQGDRLPRRTVAPKRPLSFRESLEPAGSGLGPPVDEAGGHVT